MPNMNPRPTKRDPNDPTAAVWRRIKRRRRFWLCVKLSVMLVILLLGGVVYLQSSHALRHIILPLVSKELGTVVVAEGGSVHLSGRIEVEKPILAGSDGEPALSADQLIVQIAPLSLLPGRTRVIKQASLIGPKVHVRVDWDGHSNWDFRPEFAPKKKGTIKPEKVPGSAGPSTPFSIERLEVKDMALDYANGDGLVVQVASLNLAAQGLVPGQSGTFGLTAEGSMTRPGQKIQQQGSLAAKGSLTPDAQGYPAAWESTIKASVQEDTSGSQVVQIKGNLKGTAPVGGRLDQAFELDATTSQGQVGRFTGTLAWDSAKRVREASIKVTGVKREFLNPLIALVGPVQLDRSELSGHFRLTGTGDNVAIESDVNGRDLSFRANPGEPPTPPMQLNFTQRGAWDVGRQTLHMEAANLALIENGASTPTVEVKLDAPYTIDLAAGAAAAGGKPAHLRLNLNKLTLPSARPWLTLAGQTETAGMQSGMVSGGLSVGIEQAGKVMSIDGELSGAGLKFDRWPRLALDVRQGVRARLDDLKHLKIEQAPLTVDSAGQRLAEGALTGTYDLELRQGEAQVTLNAPAALATARQFGAIGPQPVGTLGDGRLEMTQKIKIEKGGATLAAEGTARLQGMNLAGGAGSPIPLVATANYKLALAGGQLTLAPLHLELTQGASPESGSLEVTGSWPLKRDGAQTGELKLAIRKLDLGPWMAVSQTLGAEKLPPLPLEGEQTLSALADGRVKLTGEMRLGPLPDPAATTKGSSLTLKIRTDVSRLGDQLEKLTLDLAGGQSGGRSGSSADHVAIEGSGTLGGASPKVKFEARVDALTADPWMALLDSLSGPAETPERRAARQMRHEVIQENKGQKQALAAGGGTVPPGNKPKPLVFEGKFKIQNAAYRKAALNGAEGTLHYESGALDVQMDKAGLCGGTLVGKAGYDGSKIEPLFSWDLKGQGMDVKALADTFYPDYSEKVRGTGEMVSRGTGQGSGADLRRRLQSETSFVIKNGEFKNHFLLRALAEQTRIAEFQDLRFTDFNGRISIADGVATLKDWIEHGKDQMLSMEGTVRLDGKYALVIQPALGTALAQKLSKGSSAALMADDQGYLRLPLQVAITGQGEKYKLAPQLDTTAPGGQRLDDALRKVLGKGVGKQLLDRQMKKLGQENEPTTATTPAGADAKIQSKQSSKEALGGLINGLLERHNKKHKQGKKEKGPVEDGQPGGSTPDPQAPAADAVNKVKIAPTPKSPANPELAP